MGHDVMEQLKEEIKVRILQWPNVTSCFFVGFVFRANCSNSPKAFKQVFSVFKHSIGCPAVKVPSHVAGCWQSVSHCFIKDTGPLGRLHKKNWQIHQDQKKMTLEM